MEVYKFIVSDGYVYYYFGFSVFIDGSWIVVGVFGDNINGYDGGVVYFYEIVFNCTMFNICECKLGYMGPICVDVLCGNGVKEDDEICDDGNVINGDGCLVIC